MAWQMGAKQGGNLVGPAVAALDLLATQAMHEAARRHMRANTLTGEPQVVNEVLQAGIVSVPPQQRQDTRDTRQLDGLVGLRGVTVHAAESAVLAAPFGAFGLVAGQH